MSYCSMGSMVSLENETKEKAISCRGRATCGDGTRTRQDRRGRAEKPGQARESMSSRQLRETFIS